MMIRKGRCGRCTAMLLWIPRTEVSESVAVDSPVTSVIFGLSFCNDIVAQ